MKRFIIINLAIVLLFGSSQVLAQTVPTIQTSSSTENLSEAQKSAIENVVRDYLLKNPSIIREALVALEVKEAREKQELAAQNLKAYEEEIFSNPNSPTSGNEKGDISIVAFFDYNCGYCKSSLPMLNELVKNDPAIRIVYKEYPVLSQSSQFGAKAALAAHRQGKYVEFHNALIESADINDEVVRSIAEMLGLNYETLQKDMSDEKLDVYLSENYSLAAALGIEGTPSYIVGTQLILGAIDLDSLKRVVSAEREKLAEPARTKAIPTAN